MEGHAVISHDVLAAYAADAARDVAGVHGLVDGPRRHRGVRVTEEEGSLTLELNVEIEWGAAAPEVGAAVQDRVSEYLRRTAKLATIDVDVVIAAVAAPAAD